MPAAFHIGILLLLLLQVTATGELHIEQFTMTVYVWLPFRNAITRTTRKQKQTKNKANKNWHATNKEDTAAYLHDEDEEHSELEQLSE